MACSRARLAAIRRGSSDKPPRTNGSWPAAEGLLDQRRLDVEHPVAEPFLAAGLAVVQLVGMQHQAAARQAVALAAAIAEALHPGQGLADGIGVVAMRIVAVAGEVSLDAFHRTVLRGA